MNLLVNLLPTPPYDDVVVLIDTLRASTVAPVLFDNGLEQLYITPKVKQARLLAAEHQSVLLGESSGVLLEGFNYGCSPAELSRLPFSGSAVMITRNLPHVLPKVSGAKHVLLGSLYNADAVLERALTLATSSISLVCCGFDNQEDLDDAISAGYMAARLKKLRPDLTSQGATEFVMSLLKAFPDPLEAMWRSLSGDYLRHFNMADDLAIASLVSQSVKVPELQRTRYEHAFLFQHHDN